MQSKPHKKSGYTLVELLAVISIMGILSGMGVVGFQTAVSHARTKDAALNVTAYLERTANEARRLNETLCVRKGDAANKLVTYKASCDAGSFSDPIDQLVLESQVSVLENADAPGCAGEHMVNIISSTEARASFVPRQGLSSAPYEGYVVVTYGGEQGAACKEKTKNAFTPKWNPSGSWSEL